MSSYDLSKKMSMKGTYMLICLKVIFATLFVYLQGEGTGCVVHERVSKRIHVNVMLVVVFFFFSLINIMFLVFI